VDKVGNELFWCHGGAKLPLEPVVNGTTDEPFFLMSLAGPTPNLNALALNITGLNYNTVFCVYSKDTFEECNSRITTEDPTSLEGLLGQRG
jgi:hypothetical protein